MILEVTKNRENGLFNLDIDGERIIENSLQLSPIVSKIEQYLKLRFLAEVEQGGISGKLNKLWRGK